MSVGPLGNTSALSGTSQELANHARRAASDQRAELAAGLGEMDADREAADRDADGRRPWEFRGQRPSDSPSAETTVDPPTDSDVPQSKDASGNSGAMLDLSG